MLAVDRTPLSKLMHPQFQVLPRESERSTPFCVCATSDSKAFFFRPELFSKPPPASPHVAPPLDGTRAFRKVLRAVEHRR